MALYDWIPTTSAAPGQRWVVHAAVIAASVAVGLVGCTPTMPSSAIIVGPDRLRTYTWNPELGCPATWGANNTVDGVLDGAPDAVGDPAWIVTETGRTVHVIWPYGFSIRFEPGAVIYNERGGRVLSAGEAIWFGPVGLRTYAGTPEDPIPVAGIVFGGDCYPFSP